MGTTESPEIIDAPQHQPTWAEKVGNTAERLRDALTSGPPGVNQAYTPEAIAQRALEALRAEELARQQQDALRQVRPIAVTLQDSKRTDRLFNIDRRVQFGVATAYGPTGDERIITSTAQHPLAKESWADEHGNIRHRERTSAEIEDAGRRQFIKQGFREETMTFEDMQPFRIRVAWRVIREMGRLKGLVNDDETLADALKGTSLNPNPWQIPEQWLPPANQGKQRDIWPECIDLILQGEQLQPDEQYRRWNYTSGMWEIHAGLGLLPPPVPPRFLDENLEVREDYDPRMDRGLMLYVQLYSAITKRLYVEEGSDMDPNQGRYGLVGTLEPELIRMAFPTPLQIIAWELVLIDEAMDLFVNNSFLHARQALNRRYGFNLREVQLLVRLATIQATRITEGSVEDARGIMILRLEEYRRKASESLDMRAELAALKQLTIVQGLSQEQPDNFFAKLIDSVKEISAQRAAGRPRLPPPERRQLSNTEAQPVNAGG